MRLLPDDRNLGWTPWAWLIYVIPFLLTTWEARHRPGVFAANLTAMAVFLGLYFLSYWLCGRRLVLVIAAVTLLVALQLLPLPPRGGVPSRHLRRHGAVSRRSRSSSSRGRGA